MSWCDLVISEVSYPSTSVGFEISWALKRGKLVMVLYCEGGNFPTILYSFENENMLLVEYKLSNLKQTLKEYLDFIKTNSLEKRFTMLLSPKIINYLDEIAQKKKIPRSVFIRHLIEREMGKGK